MKHGLEESTVFALENPQEGQPCFENLQYSVIKELKNAVKEYGLKSTFVIGIIEGIGQGYEVTPFYWKAFVRTVVTPTQYQVWLLEYAAETQAIDNLGHNIPMGATELRGEGAFSDTCQQVRCHLQAYPQMVQIALKVWKRIPKAFDAQSSFIAIKQEATESFFTFIDSLSKTIECQLDSMTATSILLKQLA